jgi:uncharacterized protein
MSSSIPIAEGLFTWPSDAPRLIGGMCRACGTVTFPRQASCPNCTGTDTEERLLPPTGSLWTFTVQGFQPKPPYAGPADFEPYGVGYIDLGGEVMVESRLTESDPECLAIGDQMELVIVPFRRDEAGEEVVTFAFRPTQASPTQASPTEASPTEATSPERQVSKSAQPGAN